MSDSSARRRAVRAALAVATVLAVPLLGACAGGEPAEQAAPSPTPTTLAEVDAAQVEVPRLEFCELVPDAAVTAALGAEPASGDARGPGDPADETAGTTGPALQEVGCSWSAGGVTARAWVFAQPVGEEQAERVVAEAQARAGCRTEPGVAYGDPALLQRCGGEGAGPRVRYAGLLGDSWLSCELQGPGARARAEAWCVAVLESLSADR